MKKSLLEKLFGVQSGWINSGKLFAVLAFLMIFPSITMAAATGTISTMSYSPMTWTRNNGPVTIKASTTFTGVSNPSLKISIFREDIPYYNEEGGAMINIYNGVAVNGINTISFDGNLADGKKLEPGNYYALFELREAVGGTFASAISPDMLTVKANPTIISASLSKTNYDNLFGGPLTVNFYADLAGWDFASWVAIYSKDKGKILWYQTVEKTNTTNTVSWNGKGTDGKQLEVGDYTMEVKLFKPQSLFENFDSKEFPLTVSKSNLAIKLPGLGSGSTIGGGSSSGSGSSGSSGSGSSGSGSSGSSSGDSSSGASSSGSSSSSSGSSSSGSSSSGSSSDASSSTGSTSTEEKKLTPSPDILTCKARAKILYFENDAPAYDRMGVDCTLALSAKLRASVYSKSYDVKSADNSANLVRKLQTDISKNAGKYYFSWDGFDEYDQAAAMDDYVLVVEAKPGENYAPDISLQKFKIENAPTLVEVTDTTTGNTSTGSEGTDSQTKTSGSTEQLHGSAENTLDKNTSGEASSEVKVEPSKCPGVNYPNDITGSKYESIVKQAYDLCLIKGYEDGTARPEQSLTRAEAAKVLVLITDNLAKQGCYDNDCGSPFMDLDAWQGPWIRSAYDLKFVSGVGAGKFAPNREITRGEAAALLTKSFSIKPYQGCYTANCGAGYPDNIFRDIKLTWQGPYLRALWDLKVIDSSAPNRFYPDQPIKRGDILEWAFKMKEIKK